MTAFPGHVLLTTFALLIGGVGLADEPLPPKVSGALAEIAAGIAAMERDAAIMAAAAAKLRTTLVSDPSLAGPVRERLGAMLNEVEDSGLTEVRALALSLVFRSVVPGGMPADPAGHGRVTLATTGGGVRDEVFLVGPGDTAGVVHRYRVTWKDLPKRPDGTLTVGLDDSVNFALVSNDCPVRPSGSGACSLAVRLRMDGNGLRRDRLTALYGGTEQQIVLLGQGTGFPPVDVAVLPPPSTALRFDATAVAQSGTLEFRLANRGPGALPPFMPRLTSTNMPWPRFWRLDPSSSCAATGAAPGRSCSIILGFDPTMNGQEEVTVDAPLTGGQDRLRVEAFGYARGFVEDLPAGALTNGDACPAAGAAAEVVASRGVDGWGSANVVALETFVCTGWEAAGDGRMTCPGGKAGEGVTVREWERNTGTAPWRLAAVLSLFPSGAELVCADGTLERIGTR